METPSLAGRQVVERDLPFVVDVWNHEGVAPMIGGPRTNEQLTERLERWARHWDEHGFGATLFQERTTSRPVGWGGLQHATIGIGPQLTVGYVVARDAWGQGYATEIAGASVAHAFDELAADHLYASVLATNDASRRVLEKVGLTVHGEVDHGGHIELIYAIHR